jgi:magnesium transporter
MLLPVLASERWIQDGEEMPMTATPKDFYFFSELLNRRIYTPEGECLGRTVDLVVERVDPYPLVIGILVRRGLRGPTAFLHWSCIIRIEPQLTFSPGAAPVDQMTSPGPRTVYLRDQVLDKQIVDTFGAKVVRVNDIQFLHINSKLRLVHFDVGLRGLMRRIGWEKGLAVALHWMLDYQWPNNFIGWKYVQLLSGSGPLQLSVSQRKLSQLHPAELADILEDLSGHDRAAIFHALDPETAAETLEEIDDPKLQQALIETVPIEKASDIIEEMSASDAVDLLADLPQATAQEILGEMEEDRAEDLRELLVHPEETAGGMMTTAVLALPPEETVESALKRWKEEEPELDVLYYIYVVDPEGVLSGVVSMRELLVASAQQQLSEIQMGRLITVKLDARQDEVVDLLTKYGFRALPVVDDQNRLKGAIRLRSVLEILAPSTG